MFRRDIRDQFGKAIYLLQAGQQLGIPLSRSMPRVAPGVSELRLHGTDGQFRTFYCVSSARGVLVIHAFTKKTSQTPRAEIRLAQRRLKELLDEES